MFLGKLSLSHIYIYIYICLAKMSVSQIPVRKGLFGQMVCRPNVCLAKCLFGQMSVGQIPVIQTSVGQLSIGQVFFGEKRRNQAKLHRWAGWRAFNGEKNWNGILKLRGWNKLGRIGTDWSTENSALLQEISKPILNNEFTTYKLWHCFSRSNTCSQHLIFSPIH